MTPERFARLKQALLRRQHDLTALADGVHKDHNVSAIIRTCDIAHRCRKLGTDYPGLTEDGDLAANPFENL